MSKTSQTRNGSASAEEAWSGQVEKRAHKPKPGNGAALNKVYKETVLGRSSERFGRAVGVTGTALDGDKGHSEGSDMGQRV